MDPLEAGIVINEHAMLLKALDTSNSWTAETVDKNTLIDAPKTYPISI